MSAESERSRLPFEPKTKRQKPVKGKKQQPVIKQESGNQGERKPPYTKEEMAVPEVVSQRMIRRVAGFSGVPTVLGITTLIASYLLLTYADVHLPPIAVLLANMGFFGLGVLGITYGVLSASWDEDRVGGLLGWNEFTTNWGRMVEGWRETRQKKREQQRSESK
jgi:Photosynthesis affected mutant 68